MLKKSSLVGGVALGAMLAVAMAGAADAKPHKHRAHATAAGPSERSEINDLKSEVQALEAWRDQETASNAAQHQQDQSQIQALQGQLADTQARAQHAEAEVNNEIQTIPGQVQSQVASAIPKPGWWGNTSVSGRMYYDMTNVHETSNLGNSGLALGSAASTKCTALPCTITPIASGNGGHSPNGVNFDIKRFYVTVDHTFSPMFSGSITTDFLYDYASKATQLYIKKAYLQIKLSDALMFQVGSADQPWIPFDEDVYGYRYIEYTLIDRTKFGTSADWGIHALGKVPLTSDLTFGYNLAVTNGMGYKIPGFIGAANRSDAVDFEGRVNLNYKGFVAAIGGYDGKLGADYSDVLTFQTAKRFDALAAYQDKWFRIGGEFMWSHADSASQITSVTADDSHQYEVFGNVNLTPQIAIFGRYDWARPNSTTHPTVLNTYYNVGISYEPVKIVDFALVYKHDAIDNGTFADQNFGTTIPTGKILTQGTYDEVGLFGQFRW